MTMHRVYELPRREDLAPMGGWVVYQSDDQFRVTSLRSPYVRPSTSVGALSVVGGGDVRMASDEDRIRWDATALRSQAWDFWRSETEDMYSEDDGEPV
jgi:hypothetical protein